MQPKRRDVERLATLYRIQGGRKLYFSARTKFNRIKDKATKLMIKNCRSIDFSESRAYLDDTDYQARIYNDVWIVKRRTYGKRSKVRRYYDILDATTDQTRRQRITNRIKELSQ